MKEGIFLLKKNNELRKGGYLKSFHKDIMKVAFFVCILFLLFFQETTLIISKKPGNTGISRDIRTEFTTDLLLSD